MMAEDQEDSNASGSPIGRRIILGMAAVGAAGIAFGSRISGPVNRAVNALSGGSSNGLSQLLPVGNDFRIYTVTGGYPTRSIDEYQLAINGLVRNPLTLSFTDLQARPVLEMTRDFQCVTGWRVDDVHWRGVALADLLDEAQMHDSAQAIRFKSFDGVYSESLTLAQARRRDVLVAYEMIGQQVTREHGGPVRLYVPSMYGYKSIKWLESIEVVDRVIPGYWERLGYDVDAYVGASNGRRDKQIEGSELANNG